MQKDLEGRIKSAYLCIRFRSQNGVGQRTKKKSSLKILKGWNKQQVRVHEKKFNGNNDWAKEKDFESFYTMKSLILAQDER